MTRVRKTVLERQTHALTTSGLFVQHDTMNLILFSLCTQIGKHKNLSSPTESRSGTHLVRGSDPRFGETRMTSHHSDRTVVVSRKPRDVNPSAITSRVRRPLIRPRGKKRVESTAIVFRRFSRGPCEPAGRPRNPNVPKPNRTSTFRACIQWRSIAGKAPGGSK